MNVYGTKSIDTMVNSWVLGKLHFGFQQIALNDGWVLLFLGKTVFFFPSVCDDNWYVSEGVVTNDRSQVF